MNKTYLLLLYSLHLLLGIFQLLTQFGKWGVGNGEFKKPEHVAFNEKDGKGTVYVVDRGNHRIQVFVTC